MEASNSEAYNRIVSRKLYSKKVVLSIVFAFVMVASAFVIAASARAGNSTPALEAWTLLPDDKWTKGDIKGYREGEVIPVNVTLARAGSPVFVGVRIGFEWGMNPGAENEIRGFDEVVKYNYVGGDGLADDPPYAPYDNPDYYEDDGPPTPEGPFYAEPASLGNDKGEFHQSLVPSNDASGLYKDDNRYWIAWDLRFWFYEDYQEVKIFSGGLLFETTVDTLGAAYYHGSSLHIRILDLIDEQGIPVHAGGGSQDLPINVMEILTRPSIDMTKRFDPDVRAEYETSWVILTIENDGQSDAYLLDIIDTLPEELEYQQGTLKTYTSLDRTPVSIVYDPIHEDGDGDGWADGCEPAHTPEELHLEFSDLALAPYALLPGTADPNNYIRYFTFEVMVKGDPWPDGYDFVEDGRLEVTNYADIYWTDDHQGFYDPILDVPATMWIVKVAVDIVKEAWDINDPIHGQVIHCAARDYDLDGNGYSDTGSGDQIYYKMTVTNIGTEDIVSFKVQDDELKQIGFIWTWPADGQDGYSGQPSTPPLLPGGSVYKYFLFDVSGKMVDVFENEAWVKQALDAQGRDADDTSTFSLDLVKPDVSVTKVADRDIAAWYFGECVDPINGEGETITYTITVTNLDDETHVSFVLEDPMSYDEYEEGLVEDLGTAWKGTLEPADGDPDGGLDTATLILHHTVTYDDYDAGSITNTASLKSSADPEPGEDTFAYCVDAQHNPCWGRYPLTRSDTETVDVVHPLIEIDKMAVDPDTGDEIFGVEPGGLVTYQITVTNTGDVGLYWFYWDTFSDPDWTQVPTGPLDGSGYVIDGCWAVEAVDTDADDEEDDGVYCGEVPQAANPVKGYVAITINDKIGSSPELTYDEYSYEVEMTSYDSTHWRAGVYFRYTSPTDTYVAHIDDGIYLYKSGALLGSAAYPGGFALGTPYVLKVVADEVDDDLLIKVYIDGTKYIEWTDTAPLTGQKIGLAVWDEVDSAVHVHFDDVYVRDVLNPSTILLEDHFACLLPYDPASLDKPEIVFADPPGVPDSLGCEQGCEYHARLASGYMDVGADPDVRLYTYEVQPDDPNPLDNTAWAFGWHNLDQPEEYVDDSDGASVQRYAMVHGNVFNDVWRDPAKGSLIVNFPWGMYDGERNIDPMTLDYYWDLVNARYVEYGLSSNLIVIRLVNNWDGTVDSDGRPVLISSGPDKTCDEVGTTVTGDDATYGWGYFKFSSVIPGDGYVVQLFQIGDPLSMDPASLLYGSWFEVMKDDLDYYVIGDLDGGDVEKRDIPVANYGKILCYKWLDWNDNFAWETDLEAGLNGKEIRLHGYDYAGNAIPGTGSDGILGDDDYISTYTCNWHDLVPPETGDPDPAGEAGWYRFVLLPGIYEVWEALPTGWGTSTLILQPGTPVEYKPHYHNIEVTSGSPVTSTKFGNFPLVTIWGVKFFDKNYDGSQAWEDTVGGPKDNGVWDPGEETEPGLNGWTIKLWYYEADEFMYYPYIDPATEEQMEYTTKKVGDCNGYYEFTGLPPGTYKVSEVIDDTDVWVMTTLEEDLDDIGPDYPTDPQQTTGPIVLDPVKIGNLRYAIIQGVKFWDDWEGEYDDQWPDRIFTPDDPDTIGIIEGEDYVMSGTEWTFTLTGTDVLGPVSKSLTIDDGYYCFDKLLPGTYTVAEVVFDGWVPTTHKDVTIVIPAYPFGDQIVIVENFGNIAPECDPELQFGLKAGWNLWSAPLLVDGLTAKGLLNAIGPSGLVVYRLDAVSGDFQGYVAGDPDCLDFPIVFGEGYYIWALADTSFRLFGTLMSDSSSELSAGWNIIGYDQMKPIMASELMTMVEDCYAWVIAYLDEETGQFYSYVAGDPAVLDFVVEPGTAYFLWVDGSGWVSY